MDEIKINNYLFPKPLTCNNSGFSKWGIGSRGGKTYFVKEFLSPVYPADDAVFTEERKQARIRTCQRFVDGKLALYRAVREASDGHILPVEQFFRVGAKYYMTTKAITEPVMTVSQIAAASFAARLRLCCCIAHAMAGIHEKGIVHADIKPDNILVVRRAAMQPYLIDFDCGFFESDCPGPEDELNGDLVYLSPEGYLHIAGIESNLSCKMDVFSLGLVFHQYFTGQLPEFDTEQYQYAYESVLDDHPLDAHGIDDPECRWIIEQMLLKNPEDRPDMQCVFKFFNTILLLLLKRVPPRHTDANFTSSDSFFRPGEDLG